MDKPFQKNHNQHTDYEEEFLEDVADQIAYKPLRPAVVKELKDHIDDRTEEYLSEGMSPEDAVKKAVDAMGDGVAIGTGINAVRHVQSSRLLMVLTVILLLIGLAAETCTAVIPELTFRGLSIYLTGAVLLVVMALKGYPLLIRYQKRLLILAAAIFTAEAIFLSMIKFDWIADVIWDTAYIIPWHMIDYYALLLTGPVVVILLYRMRKQTQKAMAAAFLLTAGAVLIHYFTYNSFTLAETVTFLFSMIGTVLYMICRGMFAGNKRRLLIQAAAGGVVLLLFYGMLPGQSRYFQAFVNPEANAYDTLSDSYNGGSDSGAALQITAGRPDFAYAGGADGVWNRRMVFQLRRCQRGCRGREKAVFRTSPLHLPLRSVRCHFMEHSAPALREQLSSGRIHTTVRLADRNSVSYNYGRLLRSPLLLHPKDTRRARRSGVLSLRPVPAVSERALYTWELWFPVWQLY